VERSANTDFAKAEKTKEKEGFAGNDLYTARGANSPDIFNQQ